METLECVRLAGRYGHDSAQRVKITVTGTGGNMAKSGSAQPEERPNPNEKLVRVFDTEQESEAMVVRGLLESAGIDCDVTALDAPQDILPGVGGTIILVREEDAEQARRVIEEYRQSPDDLETAEINVIEEPPDQE
jgi:Putative prokaryotic signal transducing protein